MLKPKIDSIHFLAILAILSLVLYANEGRASQSVATDTASTTSATDSTTTSTDPSTDTNSADTSAPADSGANSRRKRHFDEASERRRKNSRIFYLGVCSGQVLAKQGTYLSDITSGATTATATDFKAAMKAAIQTCKDQAKTSSSSTSTTTATPTPTPTATTTTTSTN